MGQFRFIYILVLALLVGACSDDGTSPNTNNEGDNGSFAIVSVNEDTVYWEDTIVVTLRNAVSDSFRVLIQTTPVVVHSIEHGLGSERVLRFCVPENAASGSIRVFNNDTLRANGNHSLMIVPRSRASFYPTFNYFRPNKGYAGVLMMINGRDFPARLQDVKVMIDTVVLPIELLDDTRICARVAPNVRTGPVTVQIFDKRFELDIFYRLEHGGVFLAEKKLSHVEMNSSIFNPRGQLRRHDSLGTTTKIDSVPFSLDASITINGPTSIDVSDSVICVAEGSVATGLGVNANRFELRLKPGLENELSGRMRFEGIGRNIDGRITESVIDMHVESIKWRREDNVYYLYIYSTDLAKQLTDLSVKYTTSRNNVPVSDYELLSYSFNDPEAYLVLALTP